MVNRILIDSLGISEEELASQMAAAMGQSPDEELPAVYSESVKEFEVGSILPGTVLAINEQDVVVDVGYKAEGVVPLVEFGDPPQANVGDKIEVYLESVDDETGLISISKQKVDRIRGWNNIIAEKHEGDIVSGRVTRKIKGGLLVDIGVPVFLPASQVNIRRVGDIGEFIGREIKCKILKIDEQRRNIVVSRRKLLEEEREAKKRELLENIQVGEIRPGVVKNIVDFGAFVDLGGVDGLLHITDMSWSRLGHPSELLNVDQKINVKILNVDRDKEKISLGLKQKGPSPWVGIEGKYPVGLRQNGQVVNIMNYGVFVKLEDGVEGLVHISEMSWTRRVQHPSELVSVGDMVEVVVLGINKEKQEISLGMRQVGDNPWDQVEEKYPPGTRISGRVRNMTSYGAFVEIEEGIDGLLHVSDMSWTKKVNHPSEVLKKGDKIDTIVISVDKEKKRIALGLKQLLSDPWENEIPEKYLPGSIVRGKVTKITSFGVFVEMDPGLEGLLHISELTDRKIENPEEVVSIGDDVEVMILRVDAVDRKIGLSLKRGGKLSRLTDEKAEGEGEEAAPAAEEAAPAAEAEPEAPAAEAEPEAPAAEAEPEAVPEPEAAPEAAAEAPASGQTSADAGAEVASEADGEAEAKPE